MKKRQSKTRKLIRRDGTFNVESRGITGIRWTDLYHSLLTLHAGWLFVLIFGVFLLVNAGFSTLYWMSGPEHLDGIDEKNGFPFWFDCYFFSIQTFATIGYGKLVPIGWANNILTVIESFFSIMLVAVITGIVFSRFSKPVAKVLFSQKACLSVVDGEKCLYFRMANERFNQIVDVDLTVQALMTVVTKEGVTYRVPTDLKLEQTRITNFALSYTVFHVIDSNSVLKGLSPSEMKSQDIQIIVSLRGMDGTTNQNLHARYSYSPEDIMENHTFQDMMVTTREGHIEIDLSKMHRVRQVELS